MWTSWGSVVNATTIWKWSTRHEEHISPGLGHLFIQAVLIALGLHSSVSLAVDPIPLCRGHQCMFIGAEDTPPTKSKLEDSPKVLLMLRFCSKARFIDPSRGSHQTFFAQQKQNKTINIYICVCIYMYCLDPLANFAELHPHLSSFQTTRRIFEVASRKKIEVRFHLDLLPQFLSGGPGGPLKKLGWSKITPVDFGLANSRGAAWWVKLGYRPPNVLFTPSSTKNTEREIERDRQRKGTQLRVENWELRFGMREQKATDKQSRALRHLERGRQRKKREKGRWDGERDRDGERERERVRRR